MPIKYRVWLQYTTLTPTHRYKQNDRAFFVFACDSTEAISKAQQKLSDYFKEYEKPRPVVGPDVSMFWPVWPHEFQR